MPNIRKLTVLAFVGAVALLDTAAIGAQTPCASADDKSERIIGVLKNMMESSAAAARASFGLPLVAHSQITLVSNPTVCARAGEAADSVFRSWSPGATFSETPPLYVVQVGTSFVVADFSAPMTEDNEFRTVFVFGPLWEFRKLMAL